MLSAVHNGLLLFLRKTQTNIGEAHKERDTQMKNSGLRIRSQIKAHSDMSSIHKNSSDSSLPPITTQCKLSQESLLDAEDTHAQKFYPRL